VDAGAVWGSLPERERLSSNQPECGPTISSLGTQTVGGDTYGLEDVRTIGTRAGFRLRGGEGSVGFSARMAAGAERRGESSCLSLRHVLTKAG